MLQCVVLCCSALRCHAVRCSALSASWHLTTTHESRIVQYAAVCCSVLQHVAARHQHRGISREFRVLQHFAVCCSVLHCIAVYCSMLQRVICIIARHMVYMSIIDCLLGSPGAHPAPQAPQKAFNLSAYHTHLPPPLSLSMSPLLRGEGGGCVTYAKRVLIQAEPTAVFAACVLVSGLCIQSCI